MPFALSPMTSALGAEVHGLDLRAPLSPEDFDALHRALLEHLVLFFRDQPLDHFL